MMTYEMTVTYFVDADSTAEAYAMLTDALDGSRYPWEMLDDAAHLPESAHCGCVDGRVPYHLISPYTGKGVAKSITCNCPCHEVTV